MLNRYKLLKNPKVTGEIVSDIGIGVIVNAIFSLTHMEFNFVNFIDVFLGVLMIIEGNIAKYKEI